MPTESFRDLLPPEGKIKSLRGVQALILPTKHVTEAKSLLAAGALLLHGLDQPRTVTELWEAVRGDEIPSFDRFVLAAEMLYAIGAVDFRDGLLEKHRR